MNWQTTNYASLLSPLSIHSDKPSLIVLEKLQALHIEGEDSTDFLQNLLTNDVKGLADFESRLCGFCNAKGRLLAILTVIKLPSAFLLILPSDQLDFVKQRLTMFVLRSKVQITHHTDESLFALINHPTPSLTNSESTVVSALPYGNHSAIGVIKSEHTAELLQQAVQQDWLIGSDDTWQSMLIDTGIAQIYADSREAFTPQQLNLDLVDGVSFKKGCYPGQEVVARLHYLGKPSRRLFKAEMISQQSPAVNSDVLNKNGDVLGQVVAANKVKENQIALQLSMKLSSINDPAYIDSQAVTNLQRYIDEEST